MAKRHVAFSDQIRKAIDASGLSRYRIAKETGISESMMSRFMSGHGGLSMAYLDRVAALIGLTVAKERTSRKAR